MKTLIMTMFLCLAAGAALAQNPQQVTVSPIGRVIQIEGQAVRKGIEGIQAEFLTVGTLVWQYDLLKTTEMAKVVIQWRDGSMVLLSPDSQLLLTRYLFHEESRRLSASFNLQRGEVWCTAPAGPANTEHFIEVETSNALVGVQAAEFAVQWRNMQTRVYDLEGDVAIENRLHQVARLKSRQWLGIARERHFGEAETFDPKSFRLSRQPQNPTVTTSTPQPWPAPRAIAGRPETLPKPWAREWHPDHFPQRPRWIAAKN